MIDRLAQMSSTFRSALAAIALLCPLAAKAQSARASPGGPSALQVTLRGANQPPEFAASTTATANRILLPPGPPITAVLSTFEGTLELRTASGAPWHAKLNLIATPCHYADPASDEVKLRCDNGRIDARVSEVNGRRFLDLRELRGLPNTVGDEGPPRVDYPPDLFGFGSACPGDTDAAKGECAYEKGDYAKAESLFTAALAQPESKRQVAALRLGDLALRRRDPDRALMFFVKAGDQGMWGRMASERLCELTGACFDDAWMAEFDSAGMPDLLRDELELRRIRMEILLGRWGDAMDRLSQLIDREANICDGEIRPLCRRMTLAALRTRDCPREAALSTYLRLPEALHGALAVEMARAAAWDAGELGAPAYGAALLSATARFSSRADLLEHAREAIGLYLAADDPWRAHVIWSWATTRLTPTEIRQLPPDTLGPAPTAGPQAISADEIGEPEQTEAAIAISKSALARARLEAPNPPPEKKKRK